MKEQAIKKIKESIFREERTKHQLDLFFLDCLVKLIKSSKEDSVFLENTIKNPDSVVLIFEHLKKIRMSLEDLTQEQREPFEKLMCKIDDILIKDVCDILCVENQERFEDLYYR